jgi:hypothetical protein
VTLAIALNPIRTDAEEVFPQMVGGKLLAQAGILQSGVKIVMKPEKNTVMPGLFLEIHVFLQNMVNVFMVSFVDRNFNINLIIMVIKAV